MVEIRRDSLTGNVLDKTVLDTVVMGLGKESQPETGNRLLIASTGDDDVTDRDKTTTSSHYSWEAADAELMQRMREYNLGGGGASHIGSSEQQQSMMSDTEDSRNMSPKRQHQQATSPPTSSPYIASTGVCSSNPPPILEQETKTYEPLTRRRSSIKFDYDMVDYDNPVMPSVRDNEDDDDVSYTVGDISGASSRKLFEVEHDHTADEQPLDLIHLLAMRRAHTTGHDGDNDDVTSSSSGAMMYHPPEPAAACRASYMGVGETFLTSGNDKDDGGRKERNGESITDTTSDEQRRHSRGKQSGAASTSSGRRDASRLRVKTGIEEKKYRPQ